MQAQKEVGSVCWGDLGKQEVSPRPNWPGLFPGDRFCPIRVNWTFVIGSLGLAVLPRILFAARQLSNSLGFFFSFN